MIIKRKFKRITFPILAATVSLYLSILFFLGAMIGYILTRYLFKYFSKSKYFSKKAKPIKFSLGGYKIHLHHWICSFIALTAVLITGIHYYLPMFLLGIGGGVVFEGIYSFNDWHRIIYREK